MYSISEITTNLPSGFNSLFNQSLPIMEAGTINWAYLGNPSTEEEKRNKIQSIYQEHIDVPNMRVLYWEKDGHPIHLAAGIINPDDSSYILWEYALYGSDIGGSKNWLHDANYITQTKDYINTTMGLSGYKISCHQGSGLYNYHMSKVGASENYEITLESTSTPVDASDVTIATIKYHYT